MAKYKVTYLTRGGEECRTVEADSFSASSGAALFYTGRGHNTHYFQNVVSVETVEEDEPEAKDEAKPRAIYRLNLRDGKTTYIYEPKDLTVFYGGSVRLPGTALWENVKSVEVL